MFKNIFRSSYAIRANDDYLVIGKISCHRINISTYALISRLPLKGEKPEYLEKLSNLGIKDPEKIFQKL